MNIKTVFVLLLTALLSVAAVSALDMSEVVKVSKAKVNGFDLSDAQLQSFTRGSDLKLELTLVGLQDFKNAELSAYIAGYEHSDSESGLSAFKMVSVRNGITQTEMLNLKLPESLDAGKYTLTLSFASRNADTFRLQYTIDVSVPEHLVRAKELIVTPAQQVRAGEALVVKARLANVGSNDEDVRVKANIEKLGTRQSSYTSLKAGEERTSEELFLPIDACAAPGKYSLEVTTEFNDLKASSSSSYDVEVLAGDCAGATTGKSSTKSFLENALLVLVVLVLIVALIVGFSRMRSDDD